MGFVRRFWSPRRIASNTGTPAVEDDPEAEIFKNLWKQRRLLPPTDSSYSHRRNWQYFLLVITCYEQIYLPMQLAFEVPRPPVGELFQMPIVQVLFQYAVDLCFMFDIVLQFRTTVLGRPEEGSIVITDTRVISLAYTNWPDLHRGYFLYDVLACVPIDLAGFAFEGGILGTTGSFLRLNRLLHSLRIVSVHGGQIARLSRPLKILVYCTMWFFFAHMIACCWWSIGNAEVNIKSASCRCTTIWPLRLSPGTPVTKDSSFGDQYFTCFYWAATTLVKVPWVAPITWPEQAFTSVVILFGTFTFSVIIGQVTMQMKALDEARQAKSERISRMRLYCTSRKVANVVINESVQWVVADQDFASKYAGRGALGMLPSAVRAPLLQLMYANLLESFPFKKANMSNPGINAILIRLSPMVLTRGMGLIEPNSSSTTLYVLHKGCVRVALPIDKSKVAKGPDAAGGKPARHRSARVSTSPLRGVKGGGLGLKSTKEFTRFRIMERPGSTAGIADYSNPSMLYPFHVDCTRTTQLFMLKGDGLKAALEVMNADDKKICLDVLAKEFKGHVDGLKFEGSSLTAKVSKVDPNQTSEQIKTLNDLGTTINSLGQLCKSCLDTLRATKGQTTSITDLITQLGGTHNVDNSRKVTKKVLTTADKVAKASSAYATAGASDEMVESELEERTGQGMMSMGASASVEAGAMLAIT